MTARSPMPRRGGRLRASRILLWMPVLAILACGDGATEPQPENEEGVDLDALFAAPTRAELDAVRADWSTRTPSAMDVREVASATLPIGGTPASVRILAHRVDGYVHYGAVIVPEGRDPASLPVVVYAHGGDRGVSVEELVLIASLAPGLRDEFGYVVPSFRSESIRFLGVEYRSEGPPSPWDRDVDDALGLLKAALQTTPELDAERIGVVGFSRGAAVGMLMAIRDPSVDVVVEFFGPTDFFGPYVRAIVEEALQGALRDLPGLAWLDQTLLQPLRLGTVTTAQVRLELVRRSSVLFAGQLPDVQVHHGTADPVVDVSQAEALIAAMAAIGREASSFEPWIYPGGVHNPLTLPGSVDRTAAFLSARLVAPALAGQSAGPVRVRVSGVGAPAAVPLSPSPSLR